MKHLYIPLLLITILVSCSTRKKLNAPISEPNTTTNTPSDSTLLYQTWVLTKSRLNLEQNKQQAHSFTILFNNDRSISGIAQCNSFFGSWKSNINTLTINIVGTTQMACQEMQLDQSFFELLNSCYSYSISSSMLQLYNAKGKSIASFVPYP